MQIEVQKNDGEAVISVDGEIDTLTSPKLSEIIRPITAESTKVILDLAKTEYVSSAGLRVFLETKKAMDARHGEFILRNVNDSVKAVLKITGFTRILTII